MAILKEEIRTLFRKADYETEAWQAAQDDILLQGEVVVFPKITSRRVELLFKAPWEPQLLLEGQRVREDDGRLSRQLLMWVHGHLPILHRLLMQKNGLMGVLDEDGQVQVTSLIELESGVQACHGVLRTKVGGEGLRLPPFALLGRPLSRVELHQRARALFATGTLLELRGEEENRVVDHRFLEVGR